MVQTVESMAAGRPKRPVLSLRAAMPESKVDVPAVAAPDPVLAAYLDGDPRGAERLVAAFGAVVHDAIARFLAMRVPGRSDLADDLTHEVFLALFRDDGRKLRTFAGRYGCSFAGWLKVVAVRLTIDRLRRDARVVALDDETPRMLELQRSLRSDEPSPEEALQGAEIAERLARAMEQLGPKDRLLAELHLVRGRALDDVARLLGVTMNAAYVRKSRILDRLRRMLGDAR
jgi:RNA polymerase sigma-70 factor, ECF subfamily